MGFCWWRDLQTEDFFFSHLFAGLSRLFAFRFEDSWLGHKGVLIVLTIHNHRGRANLSITTEVILCFMLWVTRWVLGIGARLGLGRFSLGRGSWSYWRLQFFGLLLFGSWLDLLEHMPNFFCFGSNRWFRHDGRWNFDLFWLGLLLRFWLLQWVDINICVFACLVFDIFLDDFIVTPNSGITKRWLELSLLNIIEGVNLRRIWKRRLLWGLCCWFSLRLLLLCFRLRYFLRNCNNFSGDILFWSFLNRFTFKFWLRLL